MAGAGNRWEVREGGEHHYRDANTGSWGTKREGSGWTGRG